MKFMSKKFVAIAIIAIMMFAMAVPGFAAGADAAEAVDNTLGDKAYASAIVVGLAAAAGAIGMGMTIAKALESIGRQPEAEGKVRTTMMLGLVFIETAIIYALVVGILIIFVL